MKLAFITPTSYLEKFATQGDIYMALAHLVDDEGQNEYASFHRRKAQEDQTVMLDNGLFEGAQVSTQVLLTRARAIGASVVCAPDVLYDSEGTIKEFKRFIKSKQDFGLVAKVMGIPQASNPVDWWECFRFMELSKDCDIIGLSILSIPKAFAKHIQAKRHITDSRMYIVRQLAAYQSLLGRRITPCHFLGLGESYADIVLAQRLLPKTIISNDSSSCWIHGAKGICYSKLGDIPGGKRHKKLDFNLKQIDDVCEEHGHICIQQNIDTAKDIASWY